MVGQEGDLVCEDIAEKRAEARNLVGLLDGTKVAGDRQLNYALHVMALAQIRYESPGRSYYQRKRAAGKSHKEAMRCLKRRLSDVVFRTMATGSASSVPTKPSGYGLVTIVYPSKTMRSAERAERPGAATTHYFRAK
jgi:hypothetical protein